MFAQTPSAGLRSGGVRGQPDHGQPVAVKFGEGAHHSADVGVEVVPDQDDRGTQLPVRGGDLAGVVGFGHAAALAFTAAVQAHPVEQAAARARPQAYQARRARPPRQGGLRFRPATTAERSLAATLTTS